MNATSHGKAKFYHSRAMKIWRDHLGIIWYTSSKQVFVLEKLVTFAVKRQSKERRQKEKADGHFKSWRITQFYHWERERLILVKYVSDWESVFRSYLHLWWYRHRRWAFAWGRGQSWIPRRCKERQSRWSSLGPRRGRASSCAQEASHTHTVPQLYKNIGISVRMSVSLRSLSVSYDFFHLDKQAFRVEYLLAWRQGE